MRYEKTLNKIKITITIIWIALWLVFTWAVEYIVTNIVNILYFFDYFNIPMNNIAYEKKAVDFFTYGSGLASIFGLIFVFFQIQDIKSVSFIAKQSFEKAVAAINQTRTLASIKSIHIGLKQTVEYINSNKYKDTIISLNTVLDDYLMLTDSISSDTFEKVQIPEKIIETQQIITYIQKRILNKKEIGNQFKLKYLDHLNDLRRSFMKIQNELEKENITNLTLKN